MDEQLAKKVVHFIFRFPSSSVSSQLNYVQSIMRHVLTFSPIAIQNRHVLIYKTVAVPVACLTPDHLRSLSLSLSTVILHCVTERSGENHCHFECVQQ